MFLVPSPPASLLDRLRFLEDHIVHLERDYPPWAALHFNQPHRGVRPNDYCTVTNLTSLFLSYTVASPSSRNPTHSTVTFDIDIRAAARRE